MHLRDLGSKFGPYSSTDQQGVLRQKKNKEEELQIRVSAALYESIRNSVSTLWVLF